MSMLRHRQRAGSDAEVRLLLSARRPHDVLYAGELATLGAEVVTTYTREAPAGWTGYARRVDRAMLAEVAFPPRRAAADLRLRADRASSRAWPRTSSRSGTTPSRIRTERFGATGG